MRPLNHCLQYHLRQRQEAGGKNSPRWVLFHDTDEYLYPLDTDLTILQALDHHKETCCLLVSVRSWVRTRVAVFCSDERCSWNSTRTKMNVCGCKQNVRV